jgi:CxxC motif-containing protein
VRTDAPLPRALSDGLLQALAAQVVHLPVRVGATLLEDVAGSGVKVVFTRSLPPAEVPTVEPSLPGTELPRR